MTDTTAAPLCKTCDQAIAKAPTGDWYHLAIDWTDAAGHMAEPKDTFPIAASEHIAQLRAHLAKMTNGKLLVQYQALRDRVADDRDDPTAPTLRLGMALTVDELAKRNTQLEQALDAWANEATGSTDTHDEIVERHAAHMLPDALTHIAHPMDLDAFAGIAGADED